MAVAGLAACGGGGSPDSQPQRLPPTPAPPSPPETTAAVVPATRLVVRAKGDTAGGVAPQLEVRVNGQAVGQIAVSGASFADYAVDLPAPLAAGAALDLVFTNAGYVGSEVRVLYLSHVHAGNAWIASTDPGVTIDVGSGAAATDGQDVRPGQTNLYLNGAYRLTWPQRVPTSEARAQEAVRFLRQASFGASLADATTLMGITPEQWIAQQMVLPYTQTYVDVVQSHFDRGAAWLPGGTSYSAEWVGDAFWKTAATAPDLLRRRVAFALQQIFVVSQFDGELYVHQRPYARYLDLLAEGAFGNYRQLLEDMALSPVMGIYLSHLANQKADPQTGRQPDENFAREVMQLFSIGLYELNADGSAKIGAGGQPIETYGNADVQALARVMTGWSWGYDTLDEGHFQWIPVDYSTTGNARIDLRPMRNYPQYHSTEKSTLFAGKAWSVTVPANASGPDSLRIALDGLFNHPNVGPFIGRQLIQRLVTSNPSPAYIARVAAAFADNGQGVRGDMKAVVRAVLLDSEARPATRPATYGKLAEPVLRVAQWMRSIGVVSDSGEFLMIDQLRDAGQNLFYQPSVFNYYRPGYVPPNTALATAGVVAPEFQVASESTLAKWIEMARGMADAGLGWNGTGAEVHPVIDDEAALLAAEGAQRLIERFNLLLFAGRLSDAMRTQLLDAMAGVNLHWPSSDPARDRVRVALFLSLASPEFVVHR